MIALCAMTTSVNGFRQIVFFLALKVVYSVILSGTIMNDEVECKFFNFFFPYDKGWRLLFPFVIPVISVLCYQTTSKAFEDEFIFRLGTSMVK